MRGRVAVVSGSSAGIGAACARILVEGGAHVVGVARRLEELEGLKQDLAGAEGAFSPCALDITDIDAAEKAIDFARSVAGADPDIFVVNAGRGLPGTLLGSDAALWSEMLDLNCLAALRQMRAAASRMRAMGSQKVRDIVVLGSVVGSHVSPFNPVYGASKFAVHSAAEALRQEVAADRIRVTLIEPGIVRTEFQRTAKYDMVDFDAYEAESGPFLRGADIAALVGFAVSQPEHVSIASVVVRPTRQVTP